MLSLCGFVRVLCGFGRVLPFAFVDGLVGVAAAGERNCKGANFPLRHCSSTVLFAFCSVDIDSLAALVGIVAAKQFLFILGLRV